jgi:zinc D-Ala-D-Ala carboxypeptidase
MAARNVHRGRRRGLAAIVAMCVAAAVMFAAYAAHGVALRQAGGENRAAPRSTATGIAPIGNGNVSRLDPALRHAFVVARHDAALDGIDLHITSGWRSHLQQAALFAAAIQKYGSPAAASHWVLPAGESAHERGAAIDVGPVEAAAWLDTHGVHYGLCRRYLNEPWHFELLAPALGQPCPALEPYPHA